jgi:hypothetical protein
VTVGVGLASTVALGVIVAVVLPVVVGVAVAVGVPGVVGAPTCTGDAVKVVVGVMPSGKMKLPPGALVRVAVAVDVGVTVGVTVAVGEAPEAGAGELAAVALADGNGVPNS